MKSEAGGALGEVRRKLAEAHKALESIKALKKLREIRLQEAKVQGTGISNETLLILIL